MGQHQTREQGASSSSQHHGHGYSSTRGLPASASGGITASISASSLAPPPPPPLPAHLADDVSVDEGGLVPHGVYTGPQDYDQHFVRQNIVDRRLAPFCKGSDDEDDYAEKAFNSECPICFLYYPSPLNFSRCCHQPICTECFVQMKRADPTSTNPPSSEPRSCPFCVEPDFGVTYMPPEAIEHQKLASGGDSPNDATDATNFAEMAIGTGGVGARDVGKKKILPADDPNVITVDQVRPDWHYKLAQAEAAVARRANRRVIMRQVGDRLIPIGISSSRMGADLEAAAQSGRINLNGPGGSIILNDGQNWPGATVVTTSRRRSSRPSRGAEEALPELARMMRMGNGEDMEEIMLMEAMRLSLLEHEEQQRKQAEEENKKKQQQQQSQQSSAATAKQVDSARSSSSRGSASASQTTSLPSSSQMRPPPSTAQSVLEETEARSPLEPGPGMSSTPSRLAAAAPVNAASLGISQSTIDELSELIEGDLPKTAPSASAPSSSATTANNAPSDSIMNSPNRPVRTQLPAPEPVPVPQPVASMGSALEEMHISSANSNSNSNSNSNNMNTLNGISTGPHGYPSPPEEADRGETSKHQINYSTTSPFSPSSPISPSGTSSSGFARPPGNGVSTNPFRRSMGGPS